jgi:hypothetical protein
VTSGSETAAPPPGANFETAVETLIRKSEAARDLGDRAVDWEMSPVKPRWTTRRAYVRSVSQLYHAERLTGRACALLAGALDAPSANRFVALQADDETRHADMYRRYLARLGDVAPMDRAIADVLEEALGWRHSAPAMMVAFNVILEGEAVHLHGATLSAFPCPLLRTITSTVGRDEARHTAFGRLYLARLLAPIGVEERRAIYRDVRRLWRAVARPDPADDLRGAIMRRAWRGYMKRRWRTHCRTFERIGLIRPGEDFDR